jgi:hypothetical protein
MADAISDLLGYGQGRLAGAWPETVVIAINAARDAERSVPVGAGESGIDIDFVDCCAEGPAHMRTE